MNSTNSSTGYSPFQLQMGRSPHIIPPLTKQDRHEPEEIQAAEIIKRIENIANNAHDTLLATMVWQSHYANKNCHANNVYVIGDKVMLSTLHHHHKYIQGKSNCVAKCLPHYDGPYEIINSFPQFSATHLNYLILQMSSPLSMHQN
jgi:hypothetical protein